jgi:hypothetical protein
MHDRIGQARGMSESSSRKSGQSAALLIGIVLTLLAVVAHRFLPERRLVLDSARADANFFLMQSGDGAPADIQWIDQSRFHFACQFPKGASVEQGCSFGYQLHSEKVDHGTNLSHFHTLNLAVRYTGKAQYVRVAIRTFDPRFSRLEDLNSPKYNYVNIPSRDLAKPVAISSTPPPIQAMVPACQTSRINWRSRGGSMVARANTFVSPSTP